MRRPGPVLITTTVLLLVPVLLLGLVLPTAAAADLQPEALPRGADLTRPYLEGETIVDGDVRVDVTARTVELLGAAKGGYVVALGRFASRVGIVAPDGSFRRLPGADRDSKIGRGGRHYTEASLISDGVTRVTVRRIRDGRRLARRVFDDTGRFAAPYDLVGGRLLVGGSGGQVLVWRWKKDRVRTVVADQRRLQAGSLTEDVFAAWAAPGRRCTVVSRLSRPRRVLWRSCDERVLAFSTDGRRMVTTDRRVDVEGGYESIRELTVRGVRGRERGHFAAKAFEDVRWESRVSLGFRLVGTTQTAMVRCTGSRCETASDPRPVG